MTRGNWTDGECFYVTAIDNLDRVAQVAGPFRTHQEALDMEPRANSLGCELDPKAIWYRWGTSKWPNGHTDGVLNKQLEI